MKSKIKDVSKIRELLHEFYVSGYTQKQVRELTGIPERTQRRIKNIPKHTVKTKTETRYKYIDTFEKTTGVNLPDTKLNEAKDLLKTGLDSKYYEKYRKEIQYTTKKDITYNLKPLSNREMKIIYTGNIKEFKKITKGKPFYLRVSGFYENDDIGVNVPFSYSTKAIKNYTRGMLEYLSEFVDRFSESDIYVNTQITSISVVTI